MQPIPERKYLSIHNPHSPKCQTPPPSGIRWADMSCSRPSGSSGSQQTSRHSDTVVLMQPQLYSPLLLTITFPRTANLRARNRTPCYPSIHPSLHQSIHPRKNREARFSASVAGTPTARKRPLSLQLVPFGIIDFYST